LNCSGNSEIFAGNLYQYIQNVSTIRIADRSTGIYRHGSSTLHLRLSDEDKPYSECHEPIGGTLLETCNSLTDRSY
jgi:hypothetical protein